MTTPPLLPTSDRASTTAVATHARVRWENVGIVGAGVTIAAVATVLILGHGRGGVPTAPAGPDTATHAGITVSDEAEATPLEAARATVAEAVALAAKGSWDEANDRLATVPEAMRTESGADAATADIDARRARSAELRGQLTATVEAQRWSEADGLLDELATLAPLDSELLATRATVDAALGGPSTETTPATQDAASTDSAAPPVVATTTVPAATTSVPATTRPRPHPATGARPATGSGSSGASDVDIDAIIAQLGVSLTPAQRAELEAAVRGVLASGD
ncbi:MAG: hypothetical protein JWM98_881, partial [Thermoleophilia bacterium]|nr:hypothetical protein [Thermoleophilia bacterium]